MADLNHKIKILQLICAFFALKMSGLLRVSQDIEEMGMDVSKHGGTAYEMEGAAAKAAATSS